MTATRPPVALGAVPVHPAGGYPLGIRAEGMVATADRGLGGEPQRLPHLGRIQASFGHHDVTGIRAHVGTAASEAARSIGARAFTLGDQVAMPSDPDLHTAAHEAAHVIQQRAGVGSGDGRPGLGTHTNSTLRPLPRRW